MRTALAGSLAGLLLVAPLGASASMFEDLSASLAQTLARIAFVRASSAERPIACVLASTPSAVAGEPFILAWGSYGTYAPGEGEGSQWTKSGIATLTIGTPGMYRYSFTFSGPAGTTTCETAVAITGAR